MTKTNRTRRMVLVVALLILAAAAGALTAMLGSGRRLSYTEPPVNPSVSGKLIALPAEDKRPAPKPIAFTDSQGRAMTLDDVKGRVVLVNLWATWCPPCVAEMPDLDALQGKLGGKDFQVTAISLDRAGRAIVERWFAQAGIKNLAIHNANPADFPGALLPTSILLDKQGRVAWTGSGIYAWTKAEALDAITAVMAER
ncbi:MAG: TlpA family protein disulfide reductase [Magnetospirillum gryphiswaldense]|nr:TlpA family protein disulfide reductase [Magnetospirillum gryphiswaldense]